jgi:hypothetical protein
MLIQGRCRQRACEQAIRSTRREHGPPPLTATPVNLFGSDYTYLQVVNDVVWRMLGRRYLRIRTVYGEGTENRMARDGADEEPQHQEAQAGRDSYTAGRDQTIINNHYPPDSGHAWVDSARADLERQQARKRKDQARRVTVTQTRSSYFDGGIEFYRQPSPQVGFRRLPTNKTYYSLDATIANHGRHVIHDIEVEWQREGTPTGKRVTFPEILPYKSEHASMSIPEDCGDRRQFTAVVRFRDIDDVLWLRDAASGDLREVPEDGEPVKRNEM